MRLFLRRLDKNLEKNKTRSQESQLPYFELVAIPEEKDGEWIVLASLWQKPKGYSGNTTAWTDVKIDTAKYLAVKKEWNKDGVKTEPKVEQKMAPAITPKNYPKNEINPDDIPF